MRKQIYVCNSDGKDNRNRTEQPRRSGNRSAGGTTSCPGSCRRCQRDSPEERSHGGTVLGSARRVPHRNAVTLPRQRAPSRSQALVLTGPHELLEPPPWQHSKDKVPSNHLCPMSVLTAIAVSETAAVLKCFACTAGFCLYKAQRHVVYYARGDHPFSGQKSR